MLVPNANTQFLRTRLEIPGIMRLSLGLDSGSLTETDSEVQVEGRNSMSFIESCRLFVHHPSNTEFTGNVRITCEGSCYIIQSSTEKLKFMQDLEITAESININFVNIEVGGNLISTAGVSGNLLFNSVTTGNAAVISTAEGDALYQST